MKKSIISILISVVAVSIILPAVTHAQSVESIQVQLQLLLEQVRVLQGKLATTQGSGSSGQSWCHTFNGNLHVGDRGDEISYLQQALQSEGFTIVDADKSKEGQGTWANVIGDSTAAAVTGFQEKYRDEILTPNGLSNGTGYVGKSTRAKLNQLYGCGGGVLPPLQNGSLSIEPANASVQVGQTIQVQAFYQPPMPPCPAGVFCAQVMPAPIPVNAYSWTSSNVNVASINTIYGDCAAPPPGIICTPPSPVTMISGISSGTATIKAAYSLSGTILTATTNVTVTSGPTLQPPITVTSPNGGETWTKGTMQTIKWRDSLLPTVTPCSVGTICPPPPQQTYDIKLVPYPPCNGPVCPIYPGPPYTIAQGIYGSQDGSRYGWSVGKNLNNTIVPDGAYTVQVCQTNSPICDSSNAPFSIVTAPSQAGSVAVSLDSSSPASQIVLPTAANVVFSMIRLAAIGSAVTSLNNIQIASPNSNAQSALQNIRVYDGATLLGTSQGLTYNGSYYYAWINVSGVTIPTVGKVLSVIADISAGASGSVQLGIAGLNFNSPGSIASGLPQYGSVVAITSSQPSIAVTSPNGGERWMLNSGVTDIKWTPDPESQYVEAYLEKYQNGQYVAVGKVVKAGKGSIRWLGEIDNYANYAQPGDGYYIRLVSTQTGATDRSNAPFTILPIDYMKVDLKINGSDLISLPSGGGNVTISWTSTNTDSCAFYPSELGTALFGLPPSGARTIFLKSSPYPYSYAVSMLCSSSVGTRSDYVEIKPMTLTAPSIAVTSPNGGEVWGRGSSQWIQWSSSLSAQRSLEDFTVALTDTGGSFIGWVASTYLQKNPDGTYQITWDVNSVCKILTGATLSGCFTTSHGAYKVAVADKISQINDMSDAPFSIVTTASSAAASNENLASLLESMRSTLIFMQEKLSSLQ